MHIAWAAWVGSKLGLEVADIALRPSMLDFVRTAWLALVMLAIRLISERIFIPRLTRAFRQQFGQKAEKTARHVFDDLFIATCCLLLEVQALANTVLYNGDCTPWSTDPCMVGWPQHHPVNIAQRLYFLFMFQYYVYEMISTVLGVGTVLKADMIGHHIATGLLITCSYSVNLLRYGTMWMALFDISNPILHLAKVAHIAKLPVLKDIMLPIFALVFFVVRIVIPPYSILRPAFTKAIVILPGFWAFVFIGLMVFVCGLQYFWFYKIIKVALKGDNPDEKKSK